MARNKARRKSRKKVGSLKPAQLNLSYSLNSGTSYIDLAHDLSKVNRRLYKQGKVYAVAGISIGFVPTITFPAIQPTDLSVISAGVATAGDTWVVHNAWKKGQHCWLQQQRRARALLGCGPGNLDGAAKPKWEDFKVYLDDAHRVGTIAEVKASDGASVSGGEWAYSQFVWEDDVEAIDEVYAHLIGGNVSTTDWGLVLNYQESRATVQPDSPSLPSEYSSNMYSKLAQNTDAVADEVANNMEYANDEPPYDHDDYPGTDSNSDAPWLQQFSVCSVGQPIMRVPGFQAECGLVAFGLSGFDNVGDPKSLSGVSVVFHLMPGKYQGVLAENMGQ